MRSSEDTAAVSTLDAPVSPSQVGPALASPGTDLRKHHLPALDWLRGLAILVVFLYHCLGPAYDQDHLNFKGWLPTTDVPRSFLPLVPLTLGWAGVSVFFVISGFCIHLSFHAGGRNWRAFFIRRFFRIYPPYLLALLFFALVLPVSRLHFHSRYDLGQIGTHLLLVHNLMGSFFFGINGAFWSIAAEVQLYLIYPVLIGLTARFGWRRTLIGLAVVEVGMRFIAALPDLKEASPHVFAFIPAYHLPHLFSALPIYFWFSWSIGAGLAENYRLGKPLPYGAQWPIWLALAVGSNFLYPTTSFAPLLFSIAMVTLISRWLGSGKGLAWKKEPHAFLGKLGIWSYSLYLLHQPFLKSIPWLLEKLTTKPVPPFAIFSLCVCTFPLILMASAMYYQYCELASIRLGKRFLPMRKQKPAPGIPAWPAKTGTTPLG